MARVDMGPMFVGKKGALHTIRQSLGGICLPYQLGVPLDNTSIFSWRKVHGYEKRLWAMRRNTFMHVYITVHHVGI